MIAKLLGWAGGSSVMPWLMVGGLVLAGIGGAQVGTWRAEAACADKTEALNKRVLELTEDKHKLELAVTKANAAVDVAAAQTQAADAVREQAQRHAEDLAQFSRSRLDRLDKAVDSAATCGEVLSRYWEIRK